MPLTCQAQELQVSRRGFCLPSISSSLVRGKQGMPQCDVTFEDLLVVESKMPSPGECRKVENRDAERRSR